MYEEIVDRVVRCIAEVLAISKDEIEANSRLTEDLDAESLDLVELMFVLEQEFKIRLNKHDLSLTAQLGLPDEEIHDHEVITPKALKLLRERFPWAHGILREGVLRKDLASLLTVDEVARAVEKKLESMKKD